MKRLSVHELVREIGGRVIQGNPAYQLKHAVLFPQHIRNHTVFFDLNKGFISSHQLQAYPATVIVTERPQRYLNKGRKWTIIYVKNSNQAFWKFVHFYRGLWDIPIIGITGTCGKTTVKEMIVHILSQTMRVQATYKSKNSLVRNFAYLLGIDERTDAAVIEMGVACPDDLLHSCRLFQPQIGIITTIGIDHLQHCGSEENYIKEKGKLLQGLKNQGTLIINADDQKIMSLDMSAYQGEIIRFGQNTDAELCATDISYIDGGMAFNLNIAGQTFAGTIPGYGEHTVSNALAAIAAAKALGIRADIALARLQSFKHIEKHLEFHQAINGSILIDDTWSSNPTSTEVALKVLKQVAKGKKTVAILGSMQLLGEYAQEEHMLLGEKVVQYGIDTLITIDDQAQHISKRALQLGLPPVQIFHCPTAEQLYSLLENILDRETIALIKTSMLHPQLNLIKKLLLKERKEHETP